MHHAYWAKSQSQTLLPTALAAAPRASRWRLGAAVASCVAIFLVDVALPGVVVGFLYSLVVLGLSSAGRGQWLALVCALGTLLHTVAGVFDLPVAGLLVVVANRSLAILVLWGIGGWIAFNLTRAGKRARAGWRSITVD